MAETLNGKNDESIVKDFQTENFSNEERNFCFDSEEISLDDYFHSANFEYFESGTYSLRTIAEEDEEELSREREEEEIRKRKNPRMERKSSSDEQRKKISNANLLESMLNDLDDTCEMQFQDEEEEFFEAETKILAEEIVADTINFAIKLIAAEIREAQIAKRLEECRAEISSEKLVRPSEVRKSQRYSKTSSKSKKIENKEEPSKLSKMPIGETEKKPENEQSKVINLSSDIPVVETFEEHDRIDDLEIQNQFKDETEIPDSPPLEASQNVKKNDKKLEIQSRNISDNDNIPKPEESKPKKVQEIPAKPAKDSKIDKPNQNLSQKDRPIAQAQVPAPKSTPTKQEKVETNSTKLDCASISKSSAAGSSFTKSQRRKSFPRFPKKRRGSLKESSLFSCIMPKVKDTEDASITSLKSAIPKSSRYEEKSSCQIM
ncbi:unnamed protein product [Oikopleura dioica]|uniref:Uncharacterized protein n=1 Tax=Oikopleura dioica TaxID=34765 RepID=E4X6B7_OIKDI|nr:unnamed protein product [Oikopleura dioica]